MVVAVLALSGCADGSTSVPQLPALGNPPGQETRVHRLGIGDKVKVVVFGEQELSGTFEIDSSGRIVMPLAGPVAAKGLDTGSLQAAISRRLAEGYLKNPKVSVEVVSYRPIFVHGEVRNGGEFAFKNGLRVKDAIAVAGGYNYRANQSFVLLTREDDPREVRVDLPTNMLVMPGDNIRVPERFF